jgi:SAM-dependent methyltransferase
MSATAERAPGDGGERLDDTRAAFDSVAADYDGARGNNALIQEMRAEVWGCFDAMFVPGGTLLDLGCGTGLDAVRMAGRGHRVLATDFSPRMLERTAERARCEHLSERVATLNVGAHELARIAGEGTFDGAYSNFGALNCVPELDCVASECARLLRPGAALVLSVIGRVCPWEIAHYARRRNFARIAVRFARAQVAVGLNGRRVWTRYYTPRELYRRFAPYFHLRGYRALALLAPPPYLTQLRERHPRAHARLRALDRRVAAWPVLRNLGDHFLIVMERR